MYSEGPSYIFPNSCHEGIFNLSNTQMAFFGKHFSFFYDFSKKGHETSGFFWGEKKQKLPEKKLEILGEKIKSAREKR